MRRYGRIVGPALFVYVAASLSAQALVGSGTSDRDVTAERFFLFVAGCGVAAMILVESAKRLLPIRGWYTRRAVAHWLRTRVVPPPPSTRAIDVRDDHDAALAMGQLVEALTSPRTSIMRTTVDTDPGENVPDWASQGTIQEVVEGYEIAGAERVARDREAQRTLGEGWQRLMLRTGEGADVFNLPIEQFIGQLSAATEYALDHPRRYTTLVRAFTVRLPHSTQTGLLRQLESSQPRDSDLAGLEVDPTSRAVRAILERELVAALDQLQIYLAAGWRQTVRIGAALLAGALAFVTVTTGAFDGYNSGLYVLGAFLLSGWVSWFARDLTAIVERLRR